MAGAHRPAGTDVAARPLHVVVVGPWMRFPHGMADTGRARLLARALVEAGAQVRVICLQASERLPQVENTEVRGVWRGVPFEYTTPTTVRSDSFAIRRLVAAWGWVCGAARLARLRREGLLDVAYLWVWAPRPGVHRAALLALLKALHVPVVLELNEIPWPLREDASPLGRALSPLTGVAGVVSISSTLSRWAAAQRLRHRVQVIDVPIVVDVDEQTPAGYPGGSPLLVFAGSPVYDETIRFIYAAMEHVWRESPECRLVVTGASPADPAAQWLHGEPQGVAADPRVELAGYLPRPELLRLYARAHALLIPLFDDGRSRARFPTKIAEYLAAARPVVTSAVGEVPQYLTDAVDAVVCPPGDPRAYGERIAALLADPARAAEIGRRGLDLARRRFDYKLHGRTLYLGLAGVAGRVLAEDTAP